MAYENVLTEEHGDGSLRTGVITLHHPKQLNALNDAYNLFSWLGGLLVPVTTFTN